MSEPLKFDTIDMSQFHPIGDHRPFGRYCRTVYPRHWLRSGLHHMGLAWEYRWSEWVRERTVCRIGIHRDVEWFVNDGSAGFLACRDCAHRQNR
jgi:hypothetical protein